MPAADIDGCIWLVETHVGLVGAGVRLVGTRVGTRVGSVRVFRYQHVGMDIAKWLC